MIARPRRRRPGGAAPGRESLTAVAARGSPCADLGPVALQLAQVGRQLNGFWEYGPVRSACCPVP
ncbi:hypothetical protein [Kitasatospora albolonga]|uniref:hypothetical protein n=1 Tax=Kitasatospora albolonga TaxID=68173 RepID=UPI0031EC6E5C